jgi:hypothetical protein
VKAYLIDRFVMHLYPLCTNCQTLVLGGCNHHLQGYLVVLAYW